MPVSPLNIHVQMVAEDGTPTPEFMRWWQEFLVAVNPLSVSTGVSDLLDVIGSTRGSILIRGENGWALLTPDTDGFVLVDQGPGADPQWEAPVAVGTWLDLTDTDPTSYTGEAGQVVAVNAGEDGLEFIDPPAGGGGGDGKTYTELLLQDFSVTALSTTPVEILGLDAYDQILIYLTEASGGSSIKGELTNDGGSTWITTSLYNRLFTAQSFDGAQMANVQFHMGDASILASMLELENHNTAEAETMLRGHQGDTGDAVVETQWLETLEVHDGIRIFTSSGTKTVGILRVVGVKFAGADGATGPTGADGVAGGVSTTWEDVVGTNFDFETGDGTGWTTDIGAIRIEDWDAMTDYDTAGMTNGVNGTYFYNGGETGFGGAQAEVSSYQDIDISGDSDVIVYRHAVTAYKNFADTDVSYIELQLRDSSDNILAADFRTAVNGVIGTEYLEVSVHSHPDATTLRVRVGCDRNSGTNNNCGLDNVAVSKLVAGGGKPAVFGLYSLSTGDTISKGSDNQIQFDTEDRAASFGTLAVATGVVTISEVGTYEIHWAVALTNGSAGDTEMLVGVKVNGTKVLPETAHYHDFSWAQTINGSITVETLAVGDTIELYMNYSGAAGASDTVDTGGKFTWMQIVQQKSGGTGGGATTFIGSTRGINEDPTLTTGAWTAFALPDAASDPFGFGGVNRFEIPAGVTKVRFRVSLKPDPIGNTDNQFTIWKNGVKLTAIDGAFVMEIAETAFNSGGDSVTTSALDVVEGDYFELQYFVTSGSIGYDGFFEIEAVEHTLGGGGGGGGGGGSGLPAGGSTGQHLVKQSGADDDADWVDDQGFLGAADLVDETDATYFYWGWEDDLGGSGDWLIRRQVRATGIYLSVGEAAEPSYVDLTAAWIDRTTFTYT